MENNYQKDSQENLFSESRLRSLVKSLVYRIISVLGTGFLTWFVTKDIKETVLITIVIQIFLIILYYGYERVWNKINRGKNEKTK